jgi:hypothetical protein
LRGAFIDEMKRKTNRSGKRPWIASPEPVRSARKTPRAPKPTETSAANARMTRMPSAPEAKSTPTARPTAT